MTQLPASPVAAPQRLLAGRYRLERELGRGARATVFVATDDRLRRTVAVRLFDARVPASALAATAAVWAPGTARVLDAGVDDDGAGDPESFVVRELVDGMSLRQLTRTVRCHPSTVARVAAEVAATLASLHHVGASHGAVHGDNIFVPDFGAGSRPDDDAGTSTVLTDVCIDRSQSAADDVRALARTVLEAVTGRTVVGHRTTGTALAALHRRGVLPARERTTWTAVLTALTDPASDASARDATTALRALCGAAGH